MLTIKWQTRVRKTLPTNYWQKWMRTRYLPNLYFASVEVKTQSQENWFLCFTLTIPFKPSAARWTCAAARTSIPCLQKIIFLNNWLNSMSVLFICFKLQIFVILSISYASFKEKVKYMDGIQVNSVNLVVIFPPPFPLFCFFVSALWCFGFWGLVCESQWLYLSWFFACYQEQMFTKQWTGWIREVGIACCFNFSQNTVESFKCKLY